MVSVNLSDYCAGDDIHDDTAGYYDRRIREMAAHSPCRQPFKAKKLADRKEDDEKLKEAKGHA